MASFSSMGESIVSVRDLRKSYGDRAVLQGVSFDVLRGEILGIIGLNGMGKTTTVEIAQGLRTRDSGQVLVHGYDPAVDRAQLRHLVGSQLQSCALPDRLRVNEALRLFARLAGDVVDWRTLREEWGLTRLGQSAFGGLSGGERQRLFIALALVNAPRVVFLDELTQGLDPAARRETWRLVGLVRDQGATVVLVTHDMEEVQHLCDRVLLLHDGRVAASGTPMDLVARLGGPVRVTFTIAPTILDVLEAVPGVIEVRHDGVLADVFCDAASVVLVAGEVARYGHTPSDFAVSRPDLSDVFLTLTAPTSESPTSPSTVSMGAVR